MKRIEASIPQANRMLFTYLYYVNFLILPIVTSHP